MALSAYIKRKVLFFYKFKVLLAIFIYLTVILISEYYTYFSKIYYINEISLTIPYINESDNRMCYENFVFDDNNEKLMFPDMMDDELLNNSDGKNILFHLTNCIHDGIPRIDLR